MTRTRTAKKPKKPKLNPHRNPDAAARARGQGSKGGPHKNRSRDVAKGRSRKQKHKKPYAASVRRIALRAEGPDPSGRGWRPASGQPTRWVWADRTGELMFTVRAIPAGNTQVFALECDIGGRHRMKHKGPSTFRRPKDAFAAASRWYPGLAGHIMDFNIPNAWSRLASRSTKMTTLRKKLIRLAHANPDLRPHLLPLVKQAGTKVAHKPYMWNRGLTKEAVRDGRAAMLYFIDLGKNHSKCYEMVITEHSDGSASLTRKWGALTDSENTGKLPEKTQEFRDMGQARRAFQKLYKAKTRKGYVDAFGPKHKTPEGKKLPMGQYPVGLKRDVGFGWGTQSVAYCVPALRDMLDRVQTARNLVDQGDSTRAIGNALAQAELYVRAIADADSSMGNKIKGMLKDILHRMHGMGNYLPDETGLQMARDLNRLENYVSKQISLCNA